MRRSFLHELRHRNVLRAGVLYVGAVWALSQGIAQLGPAFGMPDWGTRWFVLACAIGFPLWLLFAWFYEFTPHGFKRESDVADDAPVRHANARKLDFAIIGTLIVAVALLGSGYFLHRIVPGDAGAPAVAAKSIAVLPFENLSNDKDNDYFVAGMQDLILTKLADIRDLKVISRSSTAKYESRPADLRSIGRQLGVATILEGSVQKAGDLVLINVQLIDTRTDAHLWAQSYTRKLDDIFGVEGDVAEKIATALRAKLSPEESAQLAAVPTTNQAAYDLFLRAEHETHLGITNYDVARLKSAAGLYREAITRDRGFALAYARLSYVESVRAWFGGGGEDAASLFRQGRDDAEHALRLAPSLAAAHVAHGYSSYYGDADYAAALESFDKALAISPSDAGALAARGYVERRQGRFDASLASLQQALAHDPRNSSLAYDVGATYMLLGRFGDAERWFVRALELDPDNLNARVFRAKAIVLGDGDVARALGVVQGDAPHLKLQRVDLLMLQRKFVEAIALLEGVADDPANFPGYGNSKALALAQLYKASGDLERARPLFEQALLHLRGELDKHQGINAASAWTSIAGAELGQGNVTAALDAVAKSTAIIARAGDKVFTPEMLLANAGLYAEAGRADLAVPLLVDALGMPGIGFGYSPVLLWLDASWDPIREDARFQAVLMQYAAYEPAVTHAANATPTGAVTAVPR